VSGTVFLRNRFPHNLKFDRNIYKKLQGKALKFLEYGKAGRGVGYWVFSGKVIKLGIISLNEVD